MKCHYNNCEASASIFCSRCHSGCYCGELCRALDVGNHRPDCFEMWCWDHPKVHLPRLKWVRIEGVPMNVGTGTHWDFWQDKFGQVTHTQVPPDNDYVNVRFHHRGSAIRCFLSCSVQFDSLGGVCVQCHPTFRFGEDDQLRQDVINFTWQFCNAAMLRYAVPAVQGNPAVSVAASLVIADASSFPVPPSAAETDKFGNAAISDDDQVDDKGGPTESEDEWFDAEGYPEAPHNVPSAAKMS